VLKSATREIVSLALSGLVLLEERAFVEFAEGLLKLLLRFHDDGGRASYGRFERLTYWEHGRLRLRYFCLPRGQVCRRISVTRVQLQIHWPSGQEETLSTHSRFGHILCTALVGSNCSFGLGPK
jgi:hypothetical protein